MLDINLIREKPKWVKEQIGKLFDAPAIERIDAIVELDQQRRDLLQEVEALKRHRNQLSKQTGRLRGDKKSPLGAKMALALALIEAVNNEQWETAIGLFDNAPEPLADDDTQVTQDQFNETMNNLFAGLKSLSDRIGALDEQIRSVDERLQEHMAWIPNLPHESVPVAESEEENVAHPEKGLRRFFDFEIKPHWDLAPEMGIIDFERGVKLAGTRSYILRGLGAHLQRAITSWLLDELVENEGFHELYVPHLVHGDVLYGSGQFPKFTDVVYKLEDSDNYMIPTAEVAMANMFAGEILDEVDLPLYLTARTPCYRQEKMSAGRDVRGIKRVHQFEKVEMFKITHPDRSYDELESMLQTAERLLDKLELPYRRLEMVTGDLGFTAARKFDIEAWAPGCEEWLEISSCSNTEDFQARRANIKYRPADGGKPQFVHMLNGSAFGMTRLLIAIIENYQTENGSVVVPTILQSYMNGIKVIEST